jgi:HKD family nuclease
MNILHAKTDPPMLQRLKEMLGSSVAADVAVGYFFISGFGEVAEDLERLDKIRILVGRTDGRVLEEVAAGLQQAEALQAQLSADGLVQRRQQDQLAQQAVAHVGQGIASLPQSEESQKAVTKLRDLIESGKIEVKAYLRGTLHAKAYLCWYDGHAEPGSAIVGSSNFTLAGFSGNTELNVRVTGDAEMAELKRWFDELWQDSKDINESLLVELDRSWPLAETPPYHVYLKALYELYGEQVSGGGIDPIPPRDVSLANYQMDAVRQALSNVDKFGGCYIADVVGLGKTFVGAEVLRQMREHYPADGEPLIICPASLVPMWQATNELFGLGAAVLSQSMISAPPESEFDEELGRYIDISTEGTGINLGEEYPRRGPVLVDEAHNFRNLSGRYHGLQKYLSTSDHKVVLMSATPQNLGPRDIYRQLRLFLDEVEHGLKIEPIRLEDYFRSVENWHKFRADFENWDEAYRLWQRTGSKGNPPERPKEPNTPKATIETVLTPVLIRRRRRDITELYGESAEINGIPVQFPDPVLSNLNYQLDQVYAKAGEFSELQDLLQRHQAFRYRAPDYLTEEARKKPEYQDLQRARNRIARLMGSLLFKRLESSIAAFRATIGSLIRSNRNFRESLQTGFVPIGNTATRLLGGELFDADELLEILEQEEARRKPSGSKNATLVHATGDFEADRWIDDLDADFSILNEISERIAGIGPDDDDKLSSLRKFLEDPEVKNGKVLIFSEAEATVDYLYEQLNPGGNDPSVAKLSGSNRGEFQNIIKRFAPTWNLRKAEKMPGPEVRVLISTDVSSEGQNLQDCARVLNYDLHWNPVKLIQRFGRVDRIGTEHTTIWLHNMWPDLAIDRGLSLTDRLLKRIQIFHDFIGLDSRILSETERLNEGAMYRIYEDKKLPDMDDGLDDISAHQRGVALLQRIQEEDPELWEIVTRLPDGLRSALKVSAPNVVDVEADRFIQAAMEIEAAQIPLLSPSSQVGEISPFDNPQPGETLVLFESGGATESYAVGNNISPRSITPSQLIAAMECLPDTPAEPLAPNTNERVMAAYSIFKEASRKKLAEGADQVAILG